MKLKYSEIELKIALRAVENKLEDDVELPTKFEEVINKYCDSTKVEPVDVANHNGITTLELANSPNRTALIQEYTELKTRSLIEDIKNIGFTDKEAWALFCKGTGVI